MKNGAHPKTATAAARRPFANVPDVDDPAPVPSAGPALPPAGPTPALGDLLEQVRAFLCDYIVFPSPEHAVTVALWIAHTWALEAFEFTPYLFIGSPVKRCGKSTLLECLALLACRPWQTVSPSPAVLFRKIEADCPTLLWDEVDAVFSAAKGDDGKEDLRAVLNAGFSRGAKVPRCVGPSHALAEFSVFCPKALAGIGRLPDTVADRSIPITLARRAPGQTVARFRRREVAPRAEALRNALTLWAAAPDTMLTLTAARPALPDVLGDRAADICEPLLAVADLAGGDWPDVARIALVRLCAPGGDAEDDNLGAKLLTACRDIFQAEGVDRMPTRDLLDRLVAREDDAPWAQWWEADINRGNVRGPASRLARLLRPFGIVRRDYRADGETVKGYLLESFQDAFGRYLPPPVPLSEKSGNAGDTA